MEAAGFLYAKLSSRIGVAAEGAVRFFERRCREADNRIYGGREHGDGFENHKIADIRSGRGCECSGTKYIPVPRRRERGDKNDVSLFRQPDEPLLREGDSLKESAWSG